MNDTAMNDTDKTDTRRPISRVILRAVLIAAVAISAFHLLLGVWANMRLQSARSTHTQGSLEFADYIPSDLPEGVINGTDYEEAASLVANGQEATHPPFTGKSNPGILEVYERLRAQAVDRSDPSADDLDFFRQQIEQQSLALAILDEGLAKTDQARYVTDWQIVPFQLEIPNLLARLHLSALIRARGEVALSEGRLDDAWNDAFAVQRMANWTCRSLPTLINALVARAMSRQGFLLVERLLAAPRVSEFLRERVWIEAQQIPWAEHFNTILNAEVSATFSTMIDPRTTSDVLTKMQAGGNDLPLYQRRLLSSSAWRKLNAATYLEWADEYFGLCKQPSRQLGNASSKFAETLPSSFWRIARDGAFDCFSVSQKRDLILAAVDQLNIALQLQKIFESEGAYPSTLNGLPSSTDPFTGRPYGYQLLPDGGYRLWSASLDLKDDGGTLAPANDKGFPDYERGDLVWWVKGNTPAPTH